MAKKPGRIGESDLSDVVLQILDEQPNKEISTTKLISQLRERVHLNTEDRKILDGRQDDRFSQIVRNIKSHQGTPGNLIHDGYLEAIPRGFRKIK